MDQNVIAAATAEIEAARAVLAKAQAAFNRKYKALKKRIDAEEAKEPMTLARALEAYRAAGENSAGYAWLQEQTWKGAWANTGFGHFGSYLIDTNQYYLGVEIKPEFTDEQLVALEGLILAALPDVKSGGHGKKDIAFTNVKSFAINSHYHHALLYFPDGRCQVVDTKDLGRSWYRGPEAEGSLMECLVYIRKSLCYGFDDSSGDDED